MLLMEQRLSNQNVYDGGGQGIRGSTLFERRKLLDMKCKFYAYINCIQLAHEPSLNQASLSRRC